MKLGLKHIAPYLPYGLKIKRTLDGSVSELHSLNIGSRVLTTMGGNIKYDHCKPILKPLYELTNDELKEELFQYYQALGIDITLVQYDSVNDNTFDMTLSVTYKLMGDVFTDVLINRGSTSETPKHIFDWLCEQNLDVFGLIDEDLAIDINTLTNE